MINVLSWNICKKNTNLLRDALKDVASENNIDIIVLQEAYGAFLNSLFALTYDEIPYPKNQQGQGVRIFLKKNTFSHFDVRREERNKLVFIHLKKNGGTEDFNIAAVHLHSKVGNTERQQLWKNLHIVEKINNFEKTASNNNRTILVGDFNQNPFENDLCDLLTINAERNKKLISAFTPNPVHIKNDFNFWYNPMWNMIGDYDFKNGGERVTGTYFRYSEDESQMWNLFDGFILRPSIMDRVDYNQSEILTKTVKTNFLKPLIIKKDESLIQDDLSDHLPVKLSISID